MKGLSLALDTSSEVLSVALGIVAGDGRTPQLIDYYHDTIGSQHSRQALSVIDTLLKNNTCNKQEIELIGVGVGPGSFTGIRVGLGIARGITRGLALRAIGASSLDLIAARTLELHPQARSIHVVSDARMGRVYSVRYTVQAAKIQRATVIDELEPHSVSPVSEDIRAGDGWRVYAESISAAIDSNAAAIIEAPDARSFFNGRLGVLAYDDAAFVPQYVRNKVAQTTAERTQAGA